MKLFADALKKGNRTEYMWKIRKRNKQVYNCYTALVFGVLSVAIPAVSFSAPTGGEIVAGTGNISQQGLNTNINQGSQKLDINWQTFSTNTNEAVNFFQPNSDAVAVNYVIGGVPSQLKGALNANGNVFILNDSGITFYGTSKVNVGSLVATTAKNVTIDANGKANFSNIGNAAVINSGDITVSDGGFAVLAAPHVENLGTIKANLGRVELAGTNGGYAVDLRGDGLITFGVSEGAANSLLVSNQGSITAKSGTVNITTQQAHDVVSNVINLAGVVDANAFGATDNGGTVLVETTGRINNSGTITADASETGNGGKVITFAHGNTNDFSSGAKISAKGGSQSGNGGFVEVSGANLVFNGSVDTSATNGALGTLLLDPTSWTIKNGSGTSTSNTVFETTLETQSTNIVLSATGGTSNTITLEDLADNLLDVTNAGAFASKTITLSTEKSGSSIVFNDLNDTIQTGSGSITIKADEKNSTINIGNLTSTSGNILVQATKSGTWTSGSVSVGNINTGSTGTVDVKGKPAVTTGNIVGGGNVVVDSADSTATLGTVSSTGGKATITAKGAINSGAVTANSDIKLDSADSSITVGALSSTNGKIEILAELAALVNGNVSAKNNVKIDSNNSSVTVNGNVNSVETDVIITSKNNAAVTGNISTTGASGDITVTSSNGSVTVDGNITSDKSKKRAVTVTSKGVTTVTGNITAGGEIKVEADNSSAESGDVVVNVGGTIDTDDKITVQSKDEGSVQAGDIISTATSAVKTVLVKAINGGSVTTGDITTDKARINLTGKNVTAENIFSNAVDALPNYALGVNVDTVSGSISLGDVEMTAATITLVSGSGGITTGDLTTDASNITLTANNGDITFGDKITSNTGDISLTGVNISGGDIDPTGDITVTADAESGTVDVGDLETDGGAILVTAGGNVTTGNVTNTDGSIDVSGANLDLGNIETEDGVLNLTAGGGEGDIKTGNITTTTTDLTDSNIQGYNIEVGVLTTGGEGVADAGDINLSPSGDLTVGGVNVVADVTSSSESADAAEYVSLQAGNSVTVTGDILVDVSASSTGSEGGSATADADFYVSAPTVDLEGTTTVKANAVSQGDSAYAYADIDVFGGTVETGGLTIEAGATGSNYADAEADLNVRGTDGLNVNGDVSVTATTTANYAYSSGESDSPEGDFAYANANIESYQGDVVVTGDVDVSATGTANEDDGIAKAFLFAGAGTEGSGDLSIEGDISVAATAVGGSFAEGDDTYGYGAFATASAELDADGNITLGTEEGGGDVNVIATADGKLSVYTDTAFFGESSSETYTYYEAPTGYAEANLDISADSAEGDSDITIHGNVNVDATATNVTGYGSSYYSYYAADADVEITTERGDITIDGNVSVAASAATTATSTEIVDLGSSSDGEGNLTDLGEDTIVTNLPVGDIEAEADLEISANGEWAEGEESSSFDGGNVQIGNGVTVAATAETGTEAYASADAEINADANVNVDGTVNVAATANGSSSADASASFSVYAGQNTGAGDVTLDGVIVTADAELANSSEGASSIDADAGVDIHAANDVTIDGDVLIVAGATVNNVEAESSADASANLHIRAGAYGQVEQYYYGSGEYSYYSYSTEAAAEGGGSVTINGDVELQANLVLDNGSVDDYSAEADADAEIEAANDVTITGDVTVAALVQNNGGYVYSSAEASADLNVYAGKAFGEGSSEFDSEEHVGSILINGDINVDATAEVNSGGYGDSSNSADADVRLFAANDVTVNGDIRVNAAAEVNGTEESGAFAHSNDADAELYIYAGGYEGAAAQGNGSVNITGDVDVLATAAVSENASADYNSASADAEIYAANDVSITGDVNVAALAQGGMSSEGYDYANGSASAELDIYAGNSEGANGDVFVDGDITVLAKEEGVVPYSYDDAYASVDVRGSNVTVTGDITAHAENDASDLYSEYSEDIAAYAEVLVTASGTEEYIEGEGEGEGEYVFTPGNIEVGGNVIATALTTIPEESGWYQNAQAYINVDAGEGGELFYGEETTLTANAGNLTQVGAGSQETSEEGVYEYAQVQQTPDVPSTSSSSSGGSSGSGSSSGGSSSGGSSSGGSSSGGSSSGGSSSGGSSSGGSSSGGSSSGGSSSGGSSSGGNSQVNNLINVLLSQLGKGNRNVNLTQSTQLGSLEPAAGGELGGADGEFCSVVNCAGME